MTALFPYNDQAKLKPLVPHVLDLTTIAPDSPALHSLALQVAAVLSVANAKPVYDAPLRAFWLIP